MTRLEWIAVDWGTTHLRAYAMQGATTLARLDCDRGMSTQTPDSFEATLLALVADWLGDDPIEAICCGMVGARQGWVEAPYASVPAEPLKAQPIQAPSTDPRLRAFVVPGLKQLDPPDVMRGEETQIAGFLARNPGWDGVIVLPGTHTKWVQVSAGEVVSFRTFMTGEMFSLLSSASVLKHSVQTDGWDKEAFADGVSTTLSQPEKLAGQLFGLRAADLLADQDKAVARARLSGLLIGTELAAARAYWLGQNLAVIGSDTTLAPYATALDLQGSQVIQADTTAMTLAGLTAVWRNIREMA